MFAIGVFGEFRPANLAVILVFAFWVPLLAVHELGHAAVAALLGWRVSRVVVGLAKPHRIYGKLASGTTNGKWGARLLIDLWSAVTSLQPSCSANAT